MNGVINENQLSVVKEHEYIKPLTHKIDSIMDNCIRDCHNRLFHTFEYKCAYDIQPTNVRNNEIFNLTISDKSIGLFEITKTKMAQRRGFIFNQIKKNITRKIYSNLSKNI